MPELSNEELALDFARRQADALRYVAAWGRWLIWTDGIWRFDETLEAVDRIRALCRDHSSRADNPSWHAIRPAREPSRRSKSSSALTWQRQATNGIKTG